MVQSFIQQDFPIFTSVQPHGKRLVYLDSAATSQKPQSVLDALTAYYTHSNANVHRGLHFLGDRSTQEWHDARSRVAQFFGTLPQNLIAVRNTTEALNILARGFEARFSPGDIILSTQMEHHSNLVPWQELAKRTGVQLHLIPVLPEGELDVDWLESFVHENGEKLKLLAFSHVSNTLGTINPVDRVVQMVRSRASQAMIVLDAAQSAPHFSLNFEKLGIDALAVSAHKMLGPMGIGGLFVGKRALSQMRPVQFGGGMIDQVQDSSASFAEDFEDRFTAGTPDVAGMVGWAAACRYLSNIGMENVAKHDRELVAYALERLTLNPRVMIAGPIDPAKRCGSVAFVYQGVHSHDVAQILDSEGIAVRSGHHCTMPLHTKMGWAATTRLSFNVYNTREDIDACVQALNKVDTVFRLAE